MKLHCTRLLALFVLLHIPTSLFAGSNSWERTLEEDNAPFRFTWDEQGRFVEMKTPFYFTVTYEYDVDDKIKQKTIWPEKPDTMSEEEFATDSLFQPRIFKREDPGFEYAVFASAMVFSIEITNFETYIARMPNLFFGVPKDAVLLRLVKKFVGMALIKQGVAKDELSDRIAEEFLRMFKMPIEDLETLANENDFSDRLRKVLIEVGTNVIKILYAHNNNKVTELLLPLDTSDVVFSGFERGLEPLNELAPDISRRLKAGLEKGHVMYLPGNVFAGKQYMAITITNNDVSTIALGDSFAELQRSEDLDAFRDYAISVDEELGIDSRAQYQAKYLMDKSRVVDTSNLHAFQTKERLLAGTLIHEFFHTLQHVSGALAQALIVRRNNLTASEMNEHLNGILDSAASINSNSFWYGHYTANLVSEQLGKIFQENKDTEAGACGPFMEMLMWHSYGIEPAAEYAAIDALAEYNRREDGPLSIPPKKDIKATELEIKPGD